MENIDRRTGDESAVERYRYLLRTAPPESIERVHVEAFGKLSPEQRRLVFEQLSANAPAGEEPDSDGVAPLARAATRSELRQPGTLERSFGGMVGSSLLGTVAGYVIGSAIVSSFFPPDGTDSSNQDHASADGADSDFGGGDAGDFGDFGF